MNTSDDRAVSEVLGFVLTFSLITMTVVIVFAVGFGGLQDAQRTEQVNNVERAFDVLTTNVDEVHREGAPSRSTEMRLSGGTLAYGDPVTVTVDTSEWEPDEALEFETRPLIYRNGDTEIVYELGGVIRTDGDHNVLLSDPPLVVGDRSTLPLLVTTTPGDQNSISGQRTVLVTSSHQRTDLVQLPPDPSVTVSIESPRADAWERYLKRTGFDVEKETNENTVEFTIDSNSTSVSVTWVRMGLR